MERSFKLPDDAVLEEKIYEAMLYVAVQCEPQVLLRYKHVDDDPLYRDLKNGFYVMTPEYPNIQENRHLQIDETLVYAVINHVCFLLSGKVDFDTSCSRWIANFRINDLNAFAGDEINEN